MENANAQSEATQSLRPPPAAAHRTPSISSPDSSSFGSLSSSSSSSSDQFPPFSPSPNKGVPFSWEQIPGIPKHTISDLNRPSGHLLPLPPAGNPAPPAAKKTGKAQSDPFIAALVACSMDKHSDHEDDHYQGRFKITRSLSDRFGFISMYASCKRTCAVSESLVYLPRSTTSPHYVNLNRPSSSDH